MKLEQNYHTPNPTEKVKTNFINQTPKGQKKKIKGVGEQLINQTGEKNILRFFFAKKYILVSSLDAGFDEQF